MKIMEEKYWVEREGYEDFREKSQCFIELRWSIFQSQTDKWLDNGNQTALYVVDRMILEK